MLIKNAMFLLLICIMSACAKTKSYYPGVEKQDQGSFFNKQQSLSAVKEHKLLDIGKKIRESGLMLCSKMKEVKGGCNFSFNLATGSEENGYINGSKIYITTAMMDFIRTDEELAIVLGHEYAHNIMGHIKPKHTNSIIDKSLEFIAHVNTDKGNSSKGSALTNASSNTGTIKFEKEADYIGLYITVLAGYDIIRAREFLHKISLQDSKSIYLGTLHPINQERYLALEKVIVEIKHKQHNGAILAPNFKD